MGGRVKPARVNGLEVAFELGDRRAARAVGRPLDEVKLPVEHAGAGLLLEDEVAVPGGDARMAWRSVKGVVGECLNHERHRQAEEAGPADDDEEEEEEEDGRRAISGTRGVVGVVAREGEEEDEEDDAVDDGRGGGRQQRGGSG